MLQEHVEMGGELGGAVITKDMGRAKFQEEDDYDKGIWWSQRMKMEYQFWEFKKILASQGFGKSFFQGQNLD